MAQKISVCRRTEILGNAKMSIVLAEDKQYYQDATVVYAGAETIYQDEDTQPITEEIPDLNFTYDYLKSMGNASRNLLYFRHDETSRIHETVRDTRTQKDRDALLRVSKRDTRIVGNSSGPNADSPWDSFKQERPKRILERYADTRLDERERGLSLKSVPLSYVVGDSKGKSHLLNVVDTPGHVNFQDEVQVANRICDGSLVVVDAVMGVTESLKRQIKSMLTVEGFAPSSLILVISQLDRLVLELRLPPTDAYFKLRHIVEEMNACVKAVCGISGLFKPQKGNVLFASGQFRFCFSLPSFARSMYVGETGGFISMAGCTIPSSAEEAETLAECLWGDVYVSEGKFSRTAHGLRSFVGFVLEPLYKIMGNSVSEEPESLKLVLEQVGVFLPKSVLEMDTREELVRVMEMLLGGSAAIVDAVTQFVPSARDGSRGKVERFYTGSQTSTIAQSMKDCSSEGPLVVHCVKSFHKPDCLSFDTWGRVMSGQISVGQTVRVLGQSYSQAKGETEDSAICQVTNLFIPGGRYYVEVESVGPGNWVLLEGLELSKTCTLISADEFEVEEFEIFRPLHHASAIIKIACEPLLPSELPKMVEGLRRLDRAYPQVETRVEESGEHVIVGSGELLLDCALHDLRKLYGDVEVKLATPTVVFNETITEGSQFQCSAASPNRLNALTFVAEQLVEGDVLFSEERRVQKTTPSFVSSEEFFLSKQWRKQRLALLTEEAGWDALAARNLWAFGPDWDTGTNVLLNDTIPDQVDKELVGEIRDSVVQGFQWATREGPLVEEPMRNCKFKLVDAVLNSNEIARGTGQLIPAACRAVFGSFLTASPKLMEPIYLVEIDCLPDKMSGIFNVLSKRRGHVIKDTPKPGTPFTTVLAYLPAIESFGFETALRLYTQGKAFGLSMFDHWALVPGDPLDSSALLQPLEPAPQQYLARDFLLKTRRRKGLTEDVHVQKYVDDVVSMGLAREGPVEEDEYY